ncbi:MAG: DUF58 domain-containing protein [Planctomycetota bacterium]
MTASPTFFDPRTLARLNGLALRARHIVEGYVAGLHRSPYRGFSIEFAEHREYAPGDDLRYVDWKVFGRTEKIYLKQYEDETNLICYLLLDTSRSMSYRGPGSALSKLEYAQCLAAALAWLVLRQQDSVGLATFDEGPRTVIRPSGSPAHWPVLLRALEQVEPAPRSDLGAAFAAPAARLVRRGVVVILSDLFDDPARLSAGLRQFRFHHHDVILLHVLDGAELSFPFDDGRRFTGLEGEPAASVDARAIRGAYLAEIEKFLAGVKSSARAQGIDYLLARTDRPFDETLAAYLAARLARVKP